jgi:pSer/pThr/pTyr-binding forkhead associated (FHA) protein
MMGRRARWDDQLEEDDRRWVQGVYEVSAAIAGGMSGGPTVDDEGRVVGINSFGATLGDSASGHRWGLPARRWRTTIGRVDADLIVDDSEVSRLHAVARRLDGTLENSDAGSANGTFVNGSRISGARRLEDGEVVKVAMTTPRVELPASAAPAARATTPTLVVTSGARSG